MVIWLEFDFKIWIYRLKLKIHWLLHNKKPVSKAHKILRA